MTPFIVVTCAGLIAHCIYLTRRCGQLEEQIRNVGIARHEEISEVAVATIVLAKKIGLTEKALAMLVDEEHDERKKTCPCDSCTRWRTERDAPIVK